MWTRIKSFFEESRQEIRHVNWPTRAEAIRLTAIVIFISVGTAIFLGFFDWIFTNLVKSFVLH
jgi:preprotein translocase subunit SecE